MSENLQSIIKAENDKITNLSNGKKPKYSKYENPQKKECTIPWCKNATSIQEFYQQKKEFKSPKKWNTNLKDTKYEITTPAFTA